MKKILKIAIIVLILVVISVILFTTGERHSNFVEYKSPAGIKYSINGEPYKTLDTGRKAEGITKGISNVIFIKINDGKVIEKDLPSNDVNIFINEIINNSENWYKEKIEN